MKKLVRDYALQLHRAGKAKVDKDTIIQTPEGEYIILVHRHDKDRTDYTSPTRRELDRLNNAALPFVKPPKKLGAREKSRLQPHEKLALAILITSYAAAGLLAIIHYF